VASRDIRQGGLPSGRVLPTSQDRPTCGRAEGNRPIDCSRSLNAARHLSSTDGSPRSKIGTRPCRTVEGSVRRHYGRSDRSRPRSKRTLSAVGLTPAAALPSASYGRFDPPRRFRGSTHSEDDVRDRVDVPRQERRRQLRAGWPRFAPPRRRAERGRSCGQPSLANRDCHRRPVRRQTRITEDGLWTVPPGWDEIGGCRP
jgi:hypothetical protein